MPCDQIQSYSIALNAADRTLLIAGLKAEYGEANVTEYGSVVSVYDGERRFTIEGDRIQLQGYQANKTTAVAVRNRVQRAYAGQVVVTQAMRFGWLIKKTGEQSMVATRRY